MIGHIHRFVQTHQIEIKKEFKKFNSRLMYLHRVIVPYIHTVRKHAHEKKFFSNRTTKRGGGGNPLNH